MRVVGKAADLDRVLGRAVAGDPDQVQVQGDPERVQVGDEHGLLAHRVVGAGCLEEAVFALRRGGVVADRAGVGARYALGGEFADSELREFSFERMPVRFQRSELGALPIARADVSQLARHQCEVQLRDLVALHEHRARLACVRSLERRELRGLDGHRLLLFGDMNGRARVLAGDRTQIVDPLE